MSKADFYGACALLEFAVIIGLICGILSYASSHTISEALASGGVGLATTLIIEAAFLALVRR